MALEVTLGDLRRGGSAEASNDRSESNMGLMRHILVSKNCLREQGLNAHVMVKRNDTLGALERGELGDINEVLNMARQMAREEKVKRGTANEEIIRNLEKAKAIRIENMPAQSEESVARHAKRAKETQEENEMANDPAQLIPKKMGEVNKWTVAQCNKMMRIWSKVAPIFNLQGDKRGWIGGPSCILKKSLKPDRVQKEPLVQEKRDHLTALMTDYEEVMKRSLAAR